MAQKSSSSGTASGGKGPAVRKGSRIQRQERRQYLIALRRARPVPTFAGAPLALNVVEQALRANPDIEVVETLGPKSVVGMLADGMHGMPNVIVARMDDSKAAILYQQGQGQLIVEPDRALTLFDVPFAAPTTTASAAVGPPVSLQFTVVDTADNPVEGAEVYIYGSVQPTMGVSDGDGQVTLELLGDTPQSIRGLYVRPKGGFWSFYQAQPSIDATQPNIVTLRPLSENYPNFPEQQIIGWGQRAMRLDQVPPDRRGQGVRIAIIDSGVATTHEDLRGITKGYDVLGKKTSANNWNVDSIAHGSHCAGIIAGNVENGKGIAGFAPAAEIHVCKIFPGGQLSQLIDALEYCVERQIDVVNLNLGLDEVSELLEQQLLRVTSLGIACIAAAGNSGGPVRYPASSPNVLAVAAIGRLGEFPAESYHQQTVQDPQVDGYFSPRFTCFGPEIAVCAPGVAIVSCVPPDSFAAWDGTSMAAPHVTGLAALVLAHHPDFSGAVKPRNAQRVWRLFQILKASARPINLGDPRRTGFGIPDAPTALGLQPAAQESTAPQMFAGASTAHFGHAMGAIPAGLFGGHGMEAPTMHAYSPPHVGSFAFGQAPWAVWNPYALGSTDRENGGASMSSQAGFWRWEPGR